MAKKRTDGSIRERRFGIGEWYGQPFASMTDAQRMGCVGAADNSRTCPFKGSPCRKKGGVCSLMLYERDEAGTVSVAHGEETAIRVLCPSRFVQDNTVYDWVAHTILEDGHATVIEEVGFLDSVLEDGEQDEEARKVGRIDNILKVANGSWCALESQAVYFSGPGMKVFFDEIAAYRDSGIPFPSQVRRPDYRSSGPKRLMPQLQIKVPTLRRWGKRMAVVVDERFFASLGPMDRVSDVSNCDIVWFVCAFSMDSGRFRLTPGQTVMVTLERAVEGLTAGKPTTLREFERRIAEKAEKL